MGKRGPKPKPTALRVLEGNPSRRALNELEPSCHLPPVKPSFLDADECASREYDRVINAMPPGIYTALDTMGLAAYAHSISIMLQAKADIDLKGTLITIFEKNEETGELCPVRVETNPSVKTWRAAVQTVIQLADRLGLTPTARTKLEVPKRDAEPQSKFASLVGKQAG